MTSNKVRRATVFVRVSIKGAAISKNALKETVVNRVSRAPGFVAGYANGWSDDGSYGRLMIVFESEKRPERPWRRPQRTTPASISYAALHRQELEGWMIIRKGLVTEVSVLSPGKRPAEPLAQVVSFNPVERPAAAVPSTSDRAAAADSSPLKWPDEAARRWAAAAPLGTIRRVGIGQVLGVR